MASFAVYWERYDEDKRDGIVPVDRWHFTSDKYKKYRERVEPGDFLFLCRQGNRVGAPPAEGHHAFLIQVLSVDEAGGNDNSLESYPLSKYPWVVKDNGHPKRLFPPVNCDCIVRPLIKNGEADPNLPFGQLAQSWVEIPAPAEAELLALMLRASDMRESDSCSV